MSTDFSSFPLLPVPSEESSSSSVVLEGNHWKISSFYLDSSGRASISLPLELDFKSEEVLKDYVKRDCFHPRPSNAETETDGETKESEGESPPTSTACSICIEAKVALTFGSGEAITSTVETVKILSTKIQGSSMIFDSEIIVRVSRPDASASLVHSKEASGVKASLDVSAVLLEKLFTQGGTNVVSYYGAVAPKRQVNYTRTKSFSLQASLTHALSMSVKSIPGPSMGHTFLALTIRHSGTHTEAITITNVALHPSHSRERPSGESSSSPSSNSSSTTVADTSKIVKWGYAPRSDPKLPLRLERYEAFSTILAVDATMDSKCRRFSCPVSVTAVLGQKERFSHRYQVLAAAEAEWETCAAFTEPLDAFRVNLSLGDQICKVGAPLTVHVEVRNLSTQARDLMLLVSTGDDDVADASGAGDASDGQVIVSERDGYTFGVKGLVVSESAGSSCSNGVRDLISVDVANLLGILQGQSNTSAILRFIPLREGSIRIPNLQLVDKKSGKKYNCLHKLRAAVLNAE